ncbi:ribitol-5-phosphate transferase FKTN-like [Oppia nitens]|uniref:ribitol-5-phosphate transferase FKTN-like n=1 Tax=Oppia nitens TaxID=1686743 RepID=UPI0023DA9EA5|nr:ribitol-5-phosphate transferase FKTN-like [Oppia nitens]
MIKTNLLFMICIVSGFLLTLQLICLQILVRKGQIEVKSSWSLLDVVTFNAHHNSIPLFIIDSEILKNISMKSHDLTRNTYCNILCSDRPIIHLATLSQFATQLLVDRFINAVKAKGYTVLQFKELDPIVNHLDIEVHILTHLIIIDESVNFEKTTHVIHIAVFYERLQSTNWWHGLLNLNDDQKRLLHRQGVKKSHFKVSLNNAIYDKVEIIRTTIDGLYLHLPNPMNNFMQKPEDVEFIECNKSQANIFREKYGREDNEEANNFRIKATLLLTKVKHILDELSVPFWLSSGTALGYYRQCDFITYSQDVDIGIWIYDYKPELIDAFSINDLLLIHRFGEIGDSFELSFLDKDIKLDIFFFYKQEDHVWNGGTQAKTGNKYKYIFPDFQLCWTELINLKVRIPCQTLTYIEANYGRNWFEPIKEWDWKSSPPNVEPNGQWPPDKWKDVIQLLPIPGF